MPKTSAGILAYRKKNELEVFLVHPGGPFYAKKDEGAWTIPKGEFVEGEDALDAARREFLEETGIAPNGELIALTPFKQKGGKMIFAWALDIDFDASSIRSNSFEMEWPPGSGKMKTFPEVDKGEWFTLEIAFSKILASQAVLLEEVRALYKA
jgi:predicted NUDIX family NTP pyrophosphohydrolase